MILNSIPPACVSLIYPPVGVEVQLGRNPANSTTAPAGMYRSATPIIPKGYMWSCPFWTVFFGLGPGRAVKTETGPTSLGLGLAKRP